MIIKNSICCNICNDIIESTYRHDYKSCKCKECAIDGGTEYLKRTGTNYTELSIVKARLEDIMQARKLLQLSLEAFNYIKNQKVIVSKDDIKDTYEIASEINKFLEK